MIQKSITAASTCLMDAWPLMSFVANNPLWHKTSHPFFSVVKSLQGNLLMQSDFYHEAYDNKRITHADIEEAIQTLSPQILKEQTVPQWAIESLKPQPSQSKSPLLYCDQIDEYEFQQPINWLRDKVLSILRDYVSYCTQSQFPVAPPRLKLLSIEQSIQQLQLPEELLTHYFEAIFFEIYGWSSLLLWQKNHPDNPWLQCAVGPEYVLQLWLHHETIIHSRVKQPYQTPAEINDHKTTFSDRLIWQYAYERHYQRHLLESLRQHQPAAPTKIKAQWVFCIDTRSEGLRRHLEQQGDHQTFGAAGFFGVTFQLHNKAHTTYQCPAILAPDKKIKQTTTFTRLGKVVSVFREMLGFVKQQWLSPFVLFEAVGVWTAPYMLMKTLFPQLGPKKSTLQTITISTKAINTAFSIDERVQLAYQFLSSIGLTHSFAAIVILCGHQADTRNNPFQAALDCGACGGNSGMANAQVMADFLNQAEVREALHAKGILIPSGTQFIAACHHTTADRVAFFTQVIDADIQKAAGIAATALQVEKFADLPGDVSLTRREVDWSELMPELALINNAAMIIGPRQLTKGLDLKRRVFLHSYDATQDSSGDVLTAILSGPGIVAHWINMQYYFSAVYPHQFAAGNKAIHNVLPGVGVMEGNLSDFKIGLPLQSIYYQSHLLHEPVRLCVVVYADPEILQSALHRSPAFKQLVDNEWVRLECISKTS